MNASEVLVERLIEWGVDTIFGLPGDGINGVSRQSRVCVRLVPGGFCHDCARLRSRSGSYRRSSACTEQLDAALSRQGPVLIEAYVDPYVPPMPAKIKAGQAIKLAEALMRSEPNRGKIVLTNLRETVREIV